jgi:hypothetical protein
MLLNQITEVAWRFYQNGKALADKQDLTKADIKQELKMLIATEIRTQYIQSKQLSDFERYDYTFVSPLLSVKRFTLTDPLDITGKRSVSLGNLDLLRLPHNAHLTNVYPFAENCAGTDMVGDITQVNLGEENFYINNPDLSFVPFMVLKGRTIDVYNLPSCVKALDIETTYDLDDKMDFPLEIASNAVQTMIGFLTKNKYQADQIAMQQELKKEAELSK